MISVDVVLRTGKVTTMYFSILPRIGEAIQITLPSMGLSTCRVRDIVHSPSDSRHTTSRITIHL